MVYFAIMAAKCPSYQLPEEEGTSLEKNMEQHNASRKYQNNLNVILVIYISKTLFNSFEIMCNYIIHILAS